MKGVRTTNKEGVELVNHQSNQVAEQFQAKAAVLSAPKIRVQSSQRVAARNKSPMDEPATLFGKWRIEQGRLAWKWTITPKPTSGPIWG
jgi:hypothetical protein